MWQALAGWGGALIYAASQVTPNLIIYLSRLGGGVSPGLSWGDSCLGFLKELQSDHGVIWKACVWLLMLAVS